MTSHIVYITWQQQWRHLFFLQGIFVMSTISYSELTYGRPTQAEDYVYPDWAVGIGWGMAAIAASTIPITAIYNYCTYCIRDGRVSVHTATLKIKSWISTWTLFFCFSLSSICSSLRVWSVTSCDRKTCTSSQKTPSIRTTSESHRPPSKITASTRRKMALKWNKKQHRNSRV